MTPEDLALRTVLLQRRGLVFLPARAEPLEDRYLRVADLELAELGYAMSSRLRDRLSRRNLAAFAQQQKWIAQTLAAAKGGNQEHVPLFRKFPSKVPKNTLQLWIKKVLVHFAQAPDQPCLFCDRVGTTHVLQPCQHVVCDDCFDGSNYSACPVCERHVDQDSPFFEPTPNQRKGNEPVTFQRIDLGEDIEASARPLFEQLCARAQALSPDDRAALKAVVDAFGTKAIAWVPETIPVRENVALVFGPLLRKLELAAVWPTVVPHLQTATDVLRLVAAYSEADPALQGEPTYRVTRVGDEDEDPRGQLASAHVDGEWVQIRRTPFVKRRFAVAKLSRKLRRALLGVLESFPPDGLAEDMLRHRSYWVWVGQFLHPHEYAKRYPQVARAFAIVRGKSPQGDPAPAFETYYGTLEAAVTRGDAAAMAELLATRPGEFARRFDHMVRTAGDDARAVAHITHTFARLVPRLSTPMLLTLATYLPTRTSPAPIRIFWPKGKTTAGVSRSDTRTPLPPQAIEPAVEAIDAELLARLGRLAAFDTVILDRELRRVLVPFNERTASSSAVQLPRGSSLDIPDGNVLRLFLHWCQPQRGRETDLDLSVALYDHEWRYRGVCSYYQLSFEAGGDQVAVSAGDLQDAPYPDGASEFVDLHLDLARKVGLRYAVMVINAYAGMSFDQLDRAFAGLMLRRDVGGKHFDARTVRLKFALSGDKGVYLPLLVDLERNTLHWLDTYSKGMFELNNVETSKAAIVKLCPEHLAYFGSGIRMSMWDLGLRHAAARGRRVLVRRDAGIEGYVRHDQETPAAFMARIEGSDAPDERTATIPTEQGSGVLALLRRGDIELPEGSEIYALFREGLFPTMAASDLIPADREG
ncbi:MAG: MXAN_6230/SCO0854 family RING domain-containing protein [Myxococcota bacterium]